MSPQTCLLANLMEAFSKLGFSLSRWLYLVPNWQELTNTLRFLKPLPQQSWYKSHSNEFKPSLSLSLQKEKRALEKALATKGRTFQKVPPCLWNSGTFSPTAREAGFIMKSLRALSPILPAFGSNYCWHFPSHSELRGQRTCLWDYMN